MLLGAELREENNQIGHIFIDGDPITLRTIAFLEAIMPQRLQVINNSRVEGLAWLGPHVSAPDRVILSE